MILTPPLLQPVLQEIVRKPSEPQPTPPTDPNNGSAPSPPG